MGPPPTSDRGPPPDDAGRRDALGAFSGALDAWIGAGGPDAALAPSARRLAANLGRLAARTAADATLLGTLERSLMGGFPERLRRLFAALEVVEPVTLADLPASLVEREIAADGRVRVTIFPRDDLADNDALRDFVGRVRAVAPDAVGSPISILESGDAVVNAFRQALVSAVAAVIVLLFVLMRRLMDVRLRRRAAVARRGTDRRRVGGVRHSLQFSPM